MKMNKRLLSFVLAVVMVLGMFPMNALATDEKEIQIHQGGSIVSGVEFPVNESVVLSANASLDTQTVTDFQWQIQVPGTDTWVAIYGETNADISVANAMIANMTDGAGKAYLRCRGIIAGEEVFSEDVSVKAAEAVHSEVEVPAYVPAAAPISESEKAADAAWEEADAKQTAADAAYDEAEAAKKAAEAAAVAVSEAEAAAAAAAEAVVTAEAAAAEKLAAADSAKAAYDAAPDETTEAAWTAAAAEAEAATTVAVEAKAAAETAAANAAAAAEAKTAAETAAAEAEVKYMAAQAEADAAIEKAAQLTDLTGAGMAAFGGRAVAETYEIRIDYIFADGTTAAESFVRHITAGTDYVLNVPSPIISGYTADRLQVEENITGISENKIFKVTYTTNIVEFNVRHMWEKVDGGYEVHETTTHSGPAFGPIGDGLAKNTYTGFAAVVYDASQFIKHDGTTVVDIHYDRLYYIMNFDLDGGYGVDPIYARYGTTVPALNAPQRAGYTFDGWNPALPATVPAKDTSYSAKWKSATQVNVNLVFWYENANDANYSYVGSTNTTAPFTPGAKVTPSQFKNVSFTGRDNYHFTFNSNKNEAVALNADGTTIVNVYFKRNTYRLIFFNCRICATNDDDDSCYPSDRKAGLDFV